MAHPDDYRDLIEDARDAVRDLLDASTPNSWLGLRASCGAIVRVLERDDRDRAQEELKEQAEEDRRKRDEWRERESAWKRVSAAQRESLLFDALGEERLVIREIAARINTALGFSSDGALESLANMKHGRW